MSRAPRHRWTDIRDRIHARILDRTWRPGDKLPRDEDIAGELGCSRSTVQRAMRDLSDAGVVERRRKGGTHVRPSPIARATLDIPITRHEVERRGGVYGYQLLSRRIETTPPRVAAAFGLAAPQDMLRVAALHLSDQRPHILEDCWISTQTAPGILDADLTDTSANEWLVLNQPYSRHELRIFAIRADAATARQMDCASGDALLVMERTTWINDDPITNVRAVMAPDHQILART